MNIKLQKFIEKQMLSGKKHINEGEMMEEDMLSEDELFEDEVNESEEKTMSEEDLKIESLKIATNIAKLMSDVTTDDIITIADKVANFIRDHSISSEDSSASDSDDSDEFELPSDEEK